MKNNFFFIKLPSFLIILIPFFLITGSFLVDLAVSICSLIFIINRFKNSLSWYFNNIFVKYFCIFWSVLILSSLLSDHPFYALFKSIFYVRFLLFSLCFWFLLDQNENLLKYLFYSLLFCFLILIFDGYLQFFFNKNIFGWSTIDTRISSLFRDELKLGSYLSRVFPIFFAIYILLLKRKIFIYKSKLFFIFINAIFFSCFYLLIFLSGERVSFFYINLSTIFLFFFLKFYRKIIIFSILISIFIILLISTFEKRFSERMFSQTLKQLSNNYESKLNQDLKKINKIFFFSKEHEDHYKSAILMFLDNKIFGIGPYGYRKNCHLDKYKVSFESCTTHPHNNYIQILAEVGIFGIVILLCTFIILIFYVLKNIFLKKVFTDFQITLFSCFLITLWPFAPTGNFFNNWLSVIYYFPLGMFIWSSNRKS
jgi:O-antigen ligase